MQSLSRAFSTLRVATVKPVIQTRQLCLTTELSRRSRDQLGFHNEEGRAIPGKRPHRGPGGIMKKHWWQYGKNSYARQRIDIFRKEPNRTAAVEDLPMFWMLEKMSPKERERLEKPDSTIQDWQNSMIARGFESPYRNPAIDGAVFRYRTAHQQRVARRRRVQMQYETHMIRLRALTKNTLLPKAVINEANDYKWMLQNGRFAGLRGIDRERVICRLHGRPVSVRPRWAIRRFPMRLLTDYGEGVCGNIRDHHGRRQREYYTDWLRTKTDIPRRPRQWHRTETYYRYQYM